MLAGRWNNTIAMYNLTLVTALYAKKNLSPPTSTTRLIHHGSSTLPPPPSPLHFLVATVPLSKCHLRAQSTIDHPPSHLHQPSALPPSSAPTPPLPKPPHQLPFSSPLLLTLTLHPTGFLKNPSLVTNSPSLNSNAYRLNTVATISASSISATFRPTQLLGP